MKAEVGDLICWSAQNRYSPMRFGIVCGFNINDEPRVIRQGRTNKTPGGNTYLILARDYAPQDAVDPQIQAAIDWWKTINLDAIRN